MIQVLRGRLAENPHGAVSIWEHPLPGLQYAIGVDTSSGIRESVKEGDPSAACVIEMRTCRQVAEIHGYQDPTMWGWASARMAWYYNTAWLAIETQPSQHGLTAFLAAERYGYPNLCRQQRLEPINSRFVERRGWVRPARSTEVLFNRIRTALNENCIVRSGRLLDELAAMRYEEGKFVSDEHDDSVVAYALALMARDQLYADGKVEEPPTPVDDMVDAYWRRELGEDTPVATSPVYEQEWDGV